MSSRDQNVREIDAKELFEMLAGVKPFGFGSGAGRAKRPIEQDIATLKAVAQRYTAPNPFKPGDLVTPRADSPLKHVGRPYVVLELAETINTDLSMVDPNHVDHIRFGAKLDIRVASVCDCPHGEVTAYWEEGWMFEPYAPPAAAVEPAAA